MRYTIYTRNILFISLFVYFSQGSLYAQGTIVSQVCLLVLMVISGYYCFKSLVLKNRQGLFFMSWTALLLLNVLGFLFTGEHLNPQHNGMFKGIVLSSILFYPCYYYSYLGVFRAKHITWFFIFMLPITILQYYFNADNIISSRVSSNLDLVNNHAYSFVWLIPFIFVFGNRKLMSIASILVVMFFVFEGAKRGAVITGFAGLMVYMMYQIGSVGKKNRFVGYLIVSISIVVLSYLSYSFYTTNEFLISRLEAVNEGGSGRDVIFSKIFEGWYDSLSLVNLLFGYGFASSITFAGNYAHNDWLELLSNFGLLGVFIYSVLFYSALSYVLDRRIPLDKRWLMLVVIVMWFLVSLFSMGYTNSSNGYLRAILCGFIVGNRNVK